MDWRCAAHGKKFAASFSGGKDSTLALHKAMKAGEAVGLLTVMEEGGQRSRSHGLPEELLRAQAESIGVPLFTAAANWADYEKEFMRLLEKAKRLGAEVLVTGDLDLPEDNCWHDNVAARAGLLLGVPLWRADRRQAVKEFIDLGFQAIVVTVNLSMGMRPDDLGRPFTHEFVKELEARGIDPCGESGEFHTAVISGPLFRHPVPVRAGEIIRDGKYAFLPLELDKTSSIPRP